jgi:hypothetical protein
MKKYVPRRYLLFGMAGAGVSGALAAQSQEQVPRANSTDNFSVVRFGAHRDGVRLDTHAIQAAIDSCSKAGGGTVQFPPGRYLSGALFLRSHVRLFLEAGSVLLGSKNLQDYPVTTPAIRSYTDNYCDKSLLYGENLEDVALEGRGKIDGQGASFEGPYKKRPFMIRMVNCRNISVSGLTLADSAMWVQHYLACQEVCICGITVRSRVRPNNDGIDIDGCEQVRISDCDISSGDDAIVLKSTSGHPCKNVTITNCLLSTACNALKIGTETNGPFENIAISNCAIYDTGLAGIALLIVDGGRMERVGISGITMNRVGTPIFIRLGDRGRPIRAEGDHPPVGKLGNVLISNLQADAAGPLGSAISGLPGSPLEEIMLENIRVRYQGGGKLSEKKEVPELPAEYPEWDMFGQLPAYGLYCRHVRNLRLHNVNLSFKEPEERAGIFCEDVRELEIGRAEVKAVRGGAPPIWLRQVRLAFLHGCRVLHPIGTYLRIEGDRTEGISLLGNDLRLAEEIAAFGDDVSREEVLLESIALKKERKP